MLEPLDVVATKLVDDQNDDQPRGRGVGRDQHCRGQDHVHDNRTDSQLSLSRCGPRSVDTGLHATGSLQSPSIDLKRHDVYRRDRGVRKRQRPFVPVFGRVNKRRHLFSKLPNRGSLRMTNLQPRSLGKRKRLSILEDCVRLVEVAGLSFRSRPPAELEKRL